LAFVSALLAKTVRSSTLKYALIWIGIFGAVVLALFGYVYWATASYVRSRSDGAIEVERRILQEAYARAGRDGLVSAIERRIAEQRFDGLYLLADPAFAAIGGNLKAWPLALDRQKGWDSFTAPRDGADHAIWRAKFDTLPDGYHLLVARQIDDLDEFARDIRSALLWCILLIFALAAMASITVTRRTVGRIETINATTRAIMQSGLGERIPLHGTRDEWDQLAENLNSMLDRIEGLMGEVKQVTDNVAHDLRTPLARMRGRLEKAYARHRDGDHDRSLIGDTLADLDGVLCMFSSLMRISRIEADDRKAAFREVDLSQLACAVVELFDAAAEERGGRLNVAGEAQVLVTGDRDLLFDALANLVDNAIKHGREAGCVTVEVAQREGRALVSVADDGPGIPGDQRQHVFKRFYRLERSRRAPGNGLGLSLVSAVARLHGARIEMLDNAPGLKFLLWFPLPGPRAAETAPPEARELGGRVPIC
jgi:signal transduction histidine kinase